MYEKIVLLISVLAFNIGYSQTIEERRKIIDSYDQNLEGSVHNKIVAFERERQDRINNYLLRNPLIEKQYEQDGILY